MRIATIDLGTNSIRFDIHDIGPRGEILRLHREKLMIRLGQGVFRSGHLAPAAIERALAAFHQFKQRADAFGVERIQAFGTSALRNASDRSRFLARIRSTTGIEVQVMSGKQEAKLIALGILHHEKLPKGVFALCDIGGGSTEISLCRGKRVLHSQSFNVGTALLQQLPIKDRGNVAVTVRKFLRETALAPLSSQRWSPVDTIIGSSGTVRAVAKLVPNNRGGKRIESKKLSTLVKRLSKATPEQMLSMRGLEPKRADMILVGALLLEEVVKALQAKVVRTTEYSLRDGMVIRAAHSPRRKDAPFPSEVIERRARALGTPSELLRSRQAIGRLLLKRLAPSVQPNWRRLLIAALSLLDAGQAISPLQSALHSRYIVEHLDAPSLRPIERAIIARLVEWGRGGKVARKDLRFLSSSKRKESFLLTLAVLRLTAALDGAKPAIIRRIQRRDDLVSIELKKEAASRLSPLRLDQAKGLYEQVEGVRLIVVIDSK